MKTSTATPSRVSPISASRRADAARRPVWHGIPCPRCVRESGRRYWSVVCRRYWSELLAIGMNPLTLGVVAV